MSIKNKIKQFKIDRSNITGMKEIGDTNFRKYYQLLDVIGKGAFGKVYLAKYRETENLYAAKSIVSREEWDEAIEKEVNILT